jgi:hypothetical protein
VRCAAISWIRHDDKAASRLSPEVNDGRLNFYVNMSARKTNCYKEAGWSGGRPGPEIFSAGEVGGPAASRDQIIVTERFGH